MYIKIQASSYEHFKHTMKNLEATNITSKLKCIEYTSNQLEN
jgi:hypothetical protein